LDNFPEAGLPTAAACADCVGAMTEGFDRGTCAAEDSGGGTGGVDGVTPLCFVVDEEPSICHFLSRVLQGSGLDTEEFQDYGSFREALARREPDLVFFNIPLESADAIATVVVLGKRGFKGAIQLISGRGSAVLEHVKNVGEQNGLRMRPVLKKPFDTGAIMKIVQDLKLGHAPAGAARIGLDEALSKKWIEFWYQPKIDLRRKQLVGAETFARVRHPEHGVLSPNAFMPGADANSLIALSELALHAVLAAGRNFSGLGVNIRLAVNIPVDALVQLSIGEIVRQHRGAGEAWPGLIIDIAEEQIVTDLPLANAITKQLHPYNIKLAIDHFGRGLSSFARLKELPFVELKLDRAIVAGCGNDRTNAPVCKTVIDLAHNLGGIAVAIGIEKAADVIALTSMGCDYGQGFLLGQPMPEERFVALLRQRAQGRLNSAAPLAEAVRQPA
jgi:EAL domain-containing protein (putative c-di-GMP-specific phosphodiesterase class I)/CheY-like chemotaxis protein